MRGRKPKPVELRVLHGQAVDQARKAQPKPRRALPRCPEHLTGDAVKCWRRTARELYDAGLLTVIDLDALAEYCVEYARRRKALEMVAKTGELILTAQKHKVTEKRDGSRVEETTGGNLVQNPWVGIANRALENMLKLEAEFGMTPSSRTRVKAAVVPEQRQTQERQPVKQVDAAHDPRRLLGS